MDKTREQRIKKYNELQALKPAVEKELLKTPGVIKVRVGAKVINGVATGELCFRVYVDHKKPANDIPRKERIPDTIRNIKTDVNEISRNITGSGGSDVKKYRPLAGGTKIFSSRAFIAGTLGCIAYDNEEENAVLLSNYHILMANGETRGHQIAQPEFCCDRSPCRCGEIAKLERGAWDDDNVDAAIATLTGDRQQKWTNEVLELGLITSLPLDEDGNPVEPPVAGDTVFKRGMNSKLTEGLIIEVGGPADSIEVGYRTKAGPVTKTFTGQIMIGPKDFDRPFTRKGDSGAVIVNHLNQVIGLHFADNEVRNNKNKVTSEATESYANPIWEVFKALDISIPDTGTLASMPLRSSEKITAPPEKDMLDELEQTILQHHPDGNMLIEAFRQHADEVMQLIKNDREVKVAWNRYRGPTFVAHMMEKVKNPDYEIPESIEGISYQRLLTKMSVVLEKKGSPEMATAIEKYSTKAFALVAGFVHSSTVTKISV